MAATVDLPVQDPIETLVRTFCPVCSIPVLEVVIGGVMYLASIHEWEPRAACSQCAATRKRKKGKRSGHCTRCGGSGYVGGKRPKVKMLGVELAWSDDGHARLVGAGTKRMRGEGLYPLHMHV